MIKAISFLGIIAGCLSVSNPSPYVELCLGGVVFFAGCKLCKMI